MSNYIMVDLETLGTRAGCGILQVGAVVVGNLDLQFEMKVDYSKNDGYGLHTDPNTLEWWHKQDPMIASEVFSGVNDLATVVSNFVLWLKSLPAKQYTLVGNGSDFDLPILKHAIAAAGFSLPRNVSKFGFCYRTLSTLNPALAIAAKNTFENKAKHDALSDAIYQAEVMNYIMEALKLGDKQ